MKFRKKPVVVDAVKWTGNNFDEIETFTDKKGFMDKVVSGSEDGEGYSQVYEKLVIPTLEGFHYANIGDWIKQEGGRLASMKKNNLNIRYILIRLSVLSKDMGGPVELRYVVNFRKKLNDAEILLSAALPSNSLNNAKAIQSVYSSFTTISSRLFFRLYLNFFFYGFALGLKNYDGLV